MPPVKPLRSGLQALNLHPGPASLPLEALPLAEKPTAPAGCPAQDTRGQVGFSWKEPHDGFPSVGAHQQHC